MSVNFGIWTRDPSQTSERVWSTARLGTGTTSRTDTKGYIFKAMDYHNFQL